MSDFLARLEWFGYSHIFALPMAAILDTILNFSKFSMIPEGHHAASDSMGLPLTKSIKNSLGGGWLFLQGLPKNQDLAARL